MTKHIKNDRGEIEKTFVENTETESEKVPKKDNLRHQVFYLLMKKISPYLNKDKKLNGPLNKIFDSTDDLREFVVDLAEECKIRHRITENELVDMDFEAFNNHYRYVWYYIYELIKLDMENVPLTPRVTRAKIRRMISLEAKQVMEESGVPFYDDEIPMNAIFRNEQDLMVFILGFSQRCRTVFDPNAIDKITFDRLQTMENVIDALEPRVSLYLTFSIPTENPPYVAFKYPKVEELYNKMISQLGLPGIPDYCMPVRVMFRDTEALLTFVKRFLIAFDMIPTPNEQVAMSKHGFDLFGQSSSLLKWLTEKLIKGRKMY